MPGDTRLQDGPDVPHQGGRQLPGEAGRQLHQAPQQEVGCGRTLCKPGQCGAQLGRAGRTGAAVTGGPAGDGWRGRAGSDPVLHQTEVRELGGSQAQQRGVQTCAVQAKSAVRFSSLPTLEHSLLALGLAQQELDREVGQEVCSVAGGWGAAARPSTAQPRVLVQQHVVQHAQLGREAAAGHGAALVGLEAELRRPENRPHLITTEWEKVTNVTILCFNYI